MSHNSCGAEVRRTYDRSPRMQVVVWCGLGPRKNWAILVHQQAHLFEPPNPSILTSRLHDGVHSAKVSISKSSQTKETRGFLVLVIHPGFDSPGWNSSNWTGEAYSLTLPLGPADTEYVSKILLESCTRTSQYFGPLHPKKLHVHNTWSSSLHTMNGPKHRSLSLEPTDHTK